MDKASFKSIWWKRKLLTFSLNFQKDFPIKKNIDWMLMFFPRKTKPHFLSFVAIFMFWIIWQWFTTFFAPRTTKSQKKIHGLLSYQSVPVVEPWIPVKEVYKGTIAFVIFVDPLDPLNGSLGVHGPSVKNLWFRMLTFWNPSHSKLVKKCTLAILCNAADVDFWCLVMPSSAYAWHCYQGSRSVVPNRIVAAH